MRCPVCGLVGSDCFHVSGHVLSRERLRGHGMQAGVGGPPACFPAFRETAMMVGAAVDMGLTRFKNRRLVVPE